MCKSLLRSVIHWLQPITAVACSRCCVRCNMVCRRSGQAPRPTGISVSQPRNCEFDQPISSKAMSCGVYTPWYAGVLIGEDGNYTPTASCDGREELKAYAILIIGLDGRLARYECNVIGRGKNQPCSIPASRIGGVPLA